uniref:Titin n=1 Tax=Haemonchus contortus TaxID=6289 RepID=A0A7I4XR94_HAECO
IRVRNRASYTPNRCSPTNSTTTHGTTCGSYRSIFFYISGTMLNFFLLYVYWHWYWHVASLWGSAVKVRFGEMVRNANNRSRRDRPRIPKQESGSLQPLDADRLARQTAIPSETALTTVRHSLTWDDVNVSQVFKEFEKKMNGKLVNGTLKNGNGESPPHAPFGLLEVPPMSKIVRARYPQKPLVIRASAKREKDETAIKHNGATKRALYRQKRASREMSTEREPFKKQTRRRDIPVEPPGVEVVANSLREDQESKRFLQNGVMLSKDTLVRRQSTVTIIPDPLVIPPITGLEENLTTSPPPPPIYATRVSENAYENRMLRQQDEEKFSFKPKQQEWIPRRRLPRTPCGTPAGEIRRPKFYLPSTEL